MPVLDFPLPLPFRQQAARVGFGRGAGRFQDVVAVERFRPCERGGAHTAAHGRVVPGLLDGDLIEAPPVAPLQNGDDLRLRPLDRGIPPRAPLAAPPRDLAPPPLPLPRAIAPTRRPFLAADDKQPP